MISIKDIYKKFDNREALSGVTLDIRENEIFGMIGTNGAGKSTLLRLIAGVFDQDKGSIEIDDFKSGTKKAKELIYLIPDEPYFPFNTQQETGKYLATYYEGFDWQQYRQLLDTFELGDNTKISNYSKGMRKRYALICGLSCNTKYLFCDETFDGLDPVMRQAVKSLMASYMEEKDFTPVITGHNLRELEDFCDHVGLLHKGGILFSKDLLDMKCNIHKIQCVFEKEDSIKEQLKDLDILKIEEKGRLRNITVRGSLEEIQEKINKWNAVYTEIMPLSLEEIFISETEVVGYDIKKLLLS